MPVLNLIGRGAWHATKYVVLIVLASIAGAHFGTWAGIAVARWTGDASWANHGRCAGWTLFVLVTAVGAPFGVVNFGAIDERKKIRNQPKDRPLERKPEVIEEKLILPEQFEGRFKSMLVGPLVGSVMGLFIGGIACGFLIGLYFFVALSPLGPGGWWPILSLTSEATGDSFSTRDPRLMSPMLFVLGFFVLTGFITGFFGTTRVGKKHYRTLRGWH